MFAHYTGTARPPPSTAPSPPPGPPPQRTAAPLPRWTATLWVSCELYGRSPPRREAERVDTF